MNILETDKIMNRLEEIIERIDVLCSLDKVKIVPLSNSNSTIAKSFKNVGNLDSILVGLSLSHLVDESFKKISSDSCSLHIETPLYLLSVSKKLLESFKHKVIEIGSNAGFQSEDFEYDVLKTPIVSFKRNRN